jgi:hypothetical protein
MDYLKLLEHSYAMAASDECPPDSRLEFLGEQVFDFTTYDGEMSATFAGKAIEVCDAINNRTTFDYIKDPENYRWFLLMCNMPFFARRLEWGTSIRGAWWDADKLESCGLYEGDEQVLLLNFTSEEWAEFARALVCFARDEVRPNR